MSGENRGATAGSGAPDPFAPWRAMYQMGEEAWSQAIDQMMGTQAFSQAMSQYLENYLKTQEAVRKGVESNLLAMNFPTKSDLTRIAAQIVAVDAKLDDLSFAIDRLSDEVQAYAERGASRGDLDEAIARLTAAVESLGAKQSESQGQQRQLAPTPLEKAAGGAKSGPRRKTTAEPTGDS